MQAHRRGSLISIGTTLFKIGRVLLRKNENFPKRLKNLFDKFWKFSIDAEGQA